MTEDQVIKLAFLEELHNIYRARGWDVAGFSKTASAHVDLMIKEARFLQALKGLGQKAQQVGSAAMQKVSPTARLQGAMQQGGMGDVVKNVQKQQGVGARLQSAGKQMAMTPAERVTAAGYKMAPGEAGQVTRAAQQMGRGGAGNRVLGGALEGAGHHISHKSTLGLMANPLGAPMGGALEGATRQVGKELVRSTGLAGQVGAGGLRGSVGRGMQQYAPHIGQAGEIAGLAAMGTAAHAPLSSAGALGTAALKGLGIKGALAGALGNVGAHGVADVAGTAMQHGAARAAPFIQRGVSAFA